MPLQLNITKPAGQDLEDIFDFSINLFGLDQTVKYVSFFETIFKKLASNPSIGRSRNEIKNGLRSFNHKSHVVFYRIKPNQIIIIRILHVSRDFKNHF